MDIENKDIALLLGKVLGEVYRLQNNQGVPVGVSKGHIYGLLHGFERAIKEELGDIGFVSEDESVAVDEVLDEHFYDQEKLAEFSGFYDIEDDLSGKEIDRGKAIRVLRYLYADDRFTDLIEKINNSGNSPTECSTLELQSWER